MEWKARVPTLKPPAHFVLLTDHFIIIIACRTIEASILNVNNNIRFSRPVLIGTFEKRDPRDLEAQAKALKKLTQASHKYKYSHRGCSHSF